MKGLYANSAEPDQMPHNVASDQGLHCLLTGFSIKNRIKAQNGPNTLKRQMDLSNIYLWKSPPVYNGFK